MPGGSPFYKSDDKIIITQAHIDNYKLLFPDSKGVPVKIENTSSIKPGTPWEFGQSGSGTIELTTGGVDIYIASNDVATKSLKLDFHYQHFNTFNQDFYVTKPCTLSFSVSTGDLSTLLNAWIHVTLVEKTNVKKLNYNSACNSKCETTFATPSYTNATNKTLILGRNDTRSSASITITQQEIDYYKALYPTATGIPVDLKGFWAGSYNVPSNTL